MTEVYSWGLNASGQLGIGGEDNSNVPKLVQGLSGKNIVHISGGMHHTVALSATGELYTFGGNEQSELGRSGRTKIPLQIDMLESVIVTSVACGDSHTLISTNLGAVLSWGHNDFGQLAQGDRETRSKPTIVKDLKSHFISLVASGSKHSLFLTQYGEVFVCGKGRDGQLGLKEYDDRRWPVIVESLWGKPIKFISAGESHSMVVTVSGNVYAFGSNKFGQLGLGPEVEQTFVATKVNQLTSIVSLHCGSNHTIAISATGPVYSFGNNLFHQLGHKSASNVSFPQVIDELMGTKTRQVCGGMRHSLALTEKQLMSWGNNSNGQLGNGDNKEREIPEIIPDFKSKPVQRIFTGRMHSFAIVSDNMLPKYPKIKKASLSRIRKAIDSAQDNNFSALESLIISVFSHPGSLNASFLKKDQVFIDSGLDLEAVREAYRKILATGSTSVLAALSNATNKVLTEMKKMQSLNIDSLRAFLIVLENPLLLNTTKQNISTLEKLATAILHVPESSRTVLHSWWKKFPSEYFIRLVHVFQRFLSFVVSMSIDSQIAPATLILADLYRINEETNIIPYNQFYNSTVSLLKNLKEDFQQYSSPNVFSMLRYPFLLDPGAKTNILHFAAQIQMEEEARNSVFMALQGHVASPFLVLKIRRDHIVEDALNQLSLQPVRALKKQLKIIFVGEEGVDEGGLRKEFFQLIVKQLFDPAYGMFTYNEETRLYWFNPTSFESEQQYTLIGILLGLAIYNGDILDFRFPHVVYKKLLGLKPNFSDFHEAMPDVALSLQKLLEYEGDVETDFDLNFQVVVDNFGEKKIFNLKKENPEEPVTNLNRKEYAELYMKYMLEDSIATQFAAFSKGFMLVCGGPLLNLFRHEELELLICGNNEDPDFRDLEKVTQYEGGFSKDNPVIKNFWEIVHSMSLTQKKKLLLFATGSDRVPIRGLGSLKFMIQRNGADSELLPSASTCFNILLLPNYTTKEKLEQKLLQAIEASEGFGLQ